MLLRKGVEAIPSATLKHTSFFAAIVLALLLGLASPALAANDILNKVRKVRTIAVFDPEVLPDERGQEALLEKFGTPLKPLPIINGWVALLTPASKALLAQSPEIRYIEDDARTYAYQYNLPWSVDRIGAERVWGGAKGATRVLPGANAGAGVDVAVIDSGIDINHPDLRDNYRGGKDFVRNDDVPEDEYGHGTHVAGVIAAEGNSGGVIGVAPKANIWALKVLDNTGAGWYSDIIDALGWAVAKGMKVVNISHGGTYPSRALRRATEKAYSAGVLLVASAGNEGSSRIIYPARYDNVIAVSAVNLDDNLASFSNFGDKIELGAPGVLIPSTMPTYRVTLNQQPFSALRNYTLLSGTSMAAPHVTGTAALIIASGITSNVNVRKKLRTTAEDLGAPGKDTQFGYGLINAAAAVGVTPPPPPTPSKGTMYVGKIELATGIRATRGSAYVRALATVTILDENGVPVEGATVDGHWESATTDSRFGTTGADGRVRIQSAAVKNPPNGTTFTFVIDDVSKEGWTWADSPGEKGTSIALTNR